MNIYHMIMETPRQIYFHGYTTKYIRHIYYIQAKQERFPCISRVNFGRVYIRIMNEDVASSHNVSIVCICIYIYICKRCIYWRIYSFIFGVILSFNMVLSVVSIIDSRYDELYYLSQKGIRHPINYCYRHLCT